MLTNEFVKTILEERKKFSEKNITIPSETTENAYALLSIISGSFIYELCEQLQVEEYNLETLTDHIEAMYSNNDYFGIIYLIFILANAVDMIVPIEFVSVAASDVFISTFTAAIIDDWLDFDFTLPDTAETE